VRSQDLLVLSVAFDEYDFSNTMIFFPSSCINNPKKNIYYQIITCFDFKFPRKSSHNIPGIYYLLFLLPKSFKN
jgi:hypothetical protein